MTHPSRRAIIGACAAAVSGALAGCGGNPDAGGGTDYRSLEIRVEPVNESIATGSDRQVTTVGARHLSAEQRAFLDELVESGRYTTEGTIPDHVEAVLERAGANVYAGERTVYVQYRGQYYEFTVRKEIE